MQNLRIISLIILISINIFSCQINPASGEKEFSLINTKEEDSIGKSEHEKIVKQYGVYYDKSLQNYVDSLGSFLVSTSELPDKKFRFTILDTPIVNAFALPGGYIYLTRGLLALCENEAQLAGVIAHEIGHITARHAARRYTKSVGTNLILNVLNTITNNIIAQNLINQSAGLFLLSYSRSQEYEADKLALRYMYRAGFETLQMANFLESMENYSKIQSRILKVKITGSELLRTHPNSSKRVNQVITETQTDAQLNPMVGRDIYLKKIDGLLYGHKEGEGFFLKNRFVHPKLEITFPLLESFYFINTPKKVLGIHDDKSQIVFDIDTSSKISSAKNYLVKWAKKSKIKLEDPKIFNINNLEFSYGESRKKKTSVVMAAIKDNNKQIIYRFSLVSKSSNFSKSKNDFITLIKSFRRCKQNEFAPPSINIITANNDANFLEKTLKSMNVQAKEAEFVFKALNNTMNKQEIIGNKVKVIY